MTDSDARIAAGLARIAARVNERATVTKATREEVREAIAKAMPGLLEFMDAGRDRLGLRLSGLDTPTLKTGKRVPEWEEL